MKPAKAAALMAAPVLALTLAACGGGSGSNASGGSGKLASTLDCTKIGALDARPVLTTVYKGDTSTGSPECDFQGLSATNDSDAYDNADKLTVALEQDPATLTAYLASKDPSLKVDASPSSDRSAYDLFTPSVWEDCHTLTDCTQHPELAAVGTDSVSGIVYKDADSSPNYSFTRNVQGYEVAADGWTYAFADAQWANAEGLNLYYVEPGGQSLHCQFVMGSHSYAVMGGTKPQSKGFLYWEQSKQAEAIKWCTDALALARS